MGVKMKAVKFIEYANTYQNNIPFTHTCMLRVRWKKKDMLHISYTHSHLHYIDIVRVYVLYFLSLILLKYRS